MPYALTDAPQDEAARSFLTDRKRFPLDAATTPDLAKILTWSDRSGPFRFKERHPELKSFRRVTIDAAQLKTAQAIAGQPAPAQKRAIKSSKASRKQPRKLTQTAKGHWRKGKAAPARFARRADLRPVRRGKRAAKAA